MLIRLLFILASFFLIAAKQVEVTDLGADRTGAAVSTRAFQDAVWQAGEGGTVTCKPGNYRVADVLLFYRAQTWDCPATILPAWNAQSLFIIDKHNDKDKPTHLNLYFHTLDGERKDVVCLDIRNSTGSSFNLIRVTGCAIGVLLKPVDVGQGVWNNTFRGQTWTVNKQAIRIEGGPGCVEGATFKVNFVAWNELGLVIPSNAHCSGTFTVFEGGFDFNTVQDAIIEAVHGWYVFTFVSPDAPPIGSGLKSSFYHIMGPKRHRVFHMPGPIVVE